MFLSELCHDIQYNLLTNSESRLDPEAEDRGAASHPLHLVVQQKNTVIRELEWSVVRSKQFFCVKKKSFKKKERNANRNVSCLHLNSTFIQSVLQWAGDTRRHADSSKLRGEGKSRFQRVVQGHADTWDTRTLQQMPSQSVFREEAHLLLDWPN